LPFHFCIFFAVLSAASFMNIIFIRKQQTCDSCVMFLLSDMLSFHVNMIINFGLIFCFTFYLVFVQSRLFS